MLNFYMNLPSLHTEVENYFCVWNEVIKYGHSDLAYI